MAKVSYTCSKCGAAHTKWAGQCDSCQAWNTLADQGPLSAGPGKTLGSKRGRSIILTDL
ncbi:MAG: DNA repair protein RadA, partial [Planktomarina sp.]|nr:DNA repair protein RadA [Planktomarina sp.]